MIRRTRGVTIDFVKLANGGGSSYKFEDKKIGLKRKKDKELEEGKKFGFIDTWKHCDGSLFALWQY